MSLISIFKKSNKNEKETIENKTNILLPSDDEQFSIPENFLEDNIRNYTRFLINIYNKVLQALYSKVYETNPQAFKLRNEKNIKLFYVTLNKDFFPEENKQLLVVYEKGSNLSIQFVDLTDEKFYKNYSDYTSNTFTNKFLSEKGYFSNKDFIESISTFLLRNIPISEKVNEIYFTKHETIYFNYMKRLVEDHARKYQTHSNLPVSYYAKNAAKYEYTALDLTPLITKVNDEDFEYQLNEAIAAYDNSLYLASCATLGVCLETLCKLLLKKNNVKTKEGNTLLSNLGPTLRENGLISYKFNSRIDVCYKVRNLASHSSPGKVLQQDCHFIINTINEMVETYY